MILVWKLRSLEHHKSTGPFSNRIKTKVPIQNYGLQVYLKIPKIVIWIKALSMDKMRV